MSWRYSAEGQSELSRMRQEIHQLTDSMRKLQEEFRCKEEDLNLINSINKAVNRGDSLREIIDLLSRETRRIFSSNGVAIYLLSDDKKFLEIQNISLSSIVLRKIEKLVGMKVPEAKARILLKEDSLYKKILRSGKPQLINGEKAIQNLVMEFTDGKLLRSFIPEIYSILNIKSVINVPIIYDGEVIGFLDIFRRKQFTKRDLKRIESISCHFATVIKCKMFEEELLRHRNCLAELVEEHTKKINLIDRGIKREITKWKRTEETLSRINQLHSLIFNAMSEGIIGIDLEGNITCVNPSALKMTGFTSEELIGKNVHQTLHQPILKDSKHETDECPITRSLMTGRKYYIAEDVFWTKDGSGLHVEYTVIPVQESNSISGAVVIFKNIEKKDRKLMEENIRQLRKMADLLQEGIFSTNLKGKLTFVNQRMTELFGYSKEEFYEMYAYELLISEDQNRLKKDMLLALNGKSFGFLEYTAIRKNSTTFPIEMVSIVVTQNQKPVGFRGIVVDISEAKRLEEELKRKTMRFKLIDGRLYLVKEYLPTLAIEAFKDLLRVGYKGCVISRTPEDEFRANVKGNFSFLWLSELGEDSLPPDVSKIEDKIRNLPNKSAILIDRLDYLFSRNGYDRVLSFVYRLREYAYLKKFIVVLSVDPLSLNERELRMLEKETYKIEPTSLELTEDYLNILKFIYKQTSVGLKPTFTDISRGTGMSRQTIKKKVNHLVSANYVVVKVKGRSKFVNLTEKGRHLFLK